MKKLLIGLAFLTLSLYPLRVQAGVPLDTAQAQVNKVFEVLRDPILKDASANDLKIERFRSISEDMFDFVEFSRRTLARNWNKLKIGQRREFVNLYRKLLEKAYMDKILTGKDEQVVFDKEIALSNHKAEVQCRILAPSKEISVNFRMILKNDKWKVYDIIIEGVSFVSNYRAQFKNILAKKSPEEFVEILRNKVG